MVPGPRWQPVGDLRLLDRLEQPVALHAPGEGGDAVGKVEAVDDLGQLPEWFGCPNKVAVSDGAVFEESHVSCQQDAVLAGRDRHQFVIRPGVGVGRVETHQSQVSRHLAEMTIQDEAGLTEWLRSDPRDRRDVESLEHRVNTDPVPVAHPVGEVDRLTIGQDEIHLGVGHAASLDHVLDASGYVEGATDLPRPVVRRQEVLQLRIEPEFDVLGWASGYRPTASHWCIHRTVSGKHRTGDGSGLTGMNRLRGRAMRRRPRGPKPPSCISGPISANPIWAQRVG